MSHLFDQEKPNYWVQIRLEYVKEIDGKTFGIKLMKKVFQMQSQKKFLEVLSSFKNMDFKAICEKRHDQLLKVVEFNKSITIDPYTVDLDPAKLPSRDKALEITNKMEEINNYDVASYFVQRSSVSLGLEDKCTYEIYTSIISGHYSARCYDTYPNGKQRHIRYNFLKDLESKGYYFSPTFGNTNQLGNSEEPPDWDYKERRWYNIYWSKESIGKKAQY